MPSFRTLLALLICLLVVSSVSAQKRGRNKKQDKSPETKADAQQTFPNDALTVVLKSAAQAAKKHEQKRILVVVQDDSRIQDAGDRTALLSAYRKRLTEQLKGLDVEAVESSEVERLAALTRPMAVMQAADVKVMQNFAEFDVVLDVIVSRRGTADRLEMSMLTTEKRLGSQTIAAPEVKVESAAATAQAGEDNKGKGNANAANPLANVPLLNRRVLQFALSQIGRQVGNGECWTLAAQALISAGARPANLFNFGQQIPLAQIQPGDILQFKSARFDVGNSYYWFGAPDHTVIVTGVEGTKVSILHQNFGEKIVSTLTIDFKNMTKGEVAAWRPVPR